MLWEAPIQKQERLEKTFEALSISRLPHAAFRVEWEYLLEELGDSTRYRRNQFKLPLDLQNAVLNKSSVLDEGPPTRLLTWAELADCVECRRSIPSSSASRASR